MIPLNPVVGLILVLEAGLASSLRNKIRNRLQELGGEVQYISGGAHPYFEVKGDLQPIHTLKPECWAGVVKVVPLSNSAPHASWGPGQSEQVSATTLQLASGQRIGPEALTVIAGPCAVETRERCLELARQVKAVGGQVFRAGAYKPRTSPYAFQGLEQVGLEILAEVKAETGLAIVTEILDVRDVEKVAAVADLLQVGSRNMHNFSLLKELGQLRHPILLKRGFAATIDELILAAEYMLSGGNDQILLCERGIRSAAGSSQVVLDLGAVPELRRRTHLPIAVDPSHGAAAVHRVAPLARAATAAGADALLIEIHDAPEQALSDGQQALSSAEFARLVPELMALREVINPTNVLQDSHPSGKGHA